ncbi:MAG: response regulator [Planctomycetes bacterium]|nr:response regulator [Planctomycetota bacterium]
MSPNSRKTILIVEDDSDFRFQQKVNLEAAGFNVIMAENENAAREVMKENEFDLAIVDLMMEAVDAGFTLCYEIKKQWPHKPVILVSVVTHETGIEFDAATDEERSWVKADVLLAKPLRFEQLSHEIERLLKNL